MAFLLSHTGTEHPQLLLSSLAPSNPHQEKLLLVSEEGWLLPVPRLLLLLHSPLLASLLSSSPLSSLSVPLPASVLAALLSTLASGRAPSASAAKVRAAAALLGVPLANCVEEREERSGRRRAAPVTLKMTFQPGQDGEEELQEAETTPANMDAFANRESGFGQVWGDVESGGRKEPVLKKEKAAPKGKAGRPKKAKQEKKAMLEPKQETDPMEMIVVDETEKSGLNQEEERIHNPLAMVIVDETDQSDNNQDLSEEAIDNPDEVTVDEKSWDFIAKNFIEDVAQDDKLINKLTSNKPETSVTSGPQVNQEEWSCGMCPKKFAKQNFLENHVNNKHTGPNASAVPEFPCTVCPKKFGAEEFLMKHYARMHNMKNGPQGIYKCPNRECKMSFNTIPEFNSHRNIHMTKCTICDKEMYDQNLATHMKNQHPDGEATKLKITEN